MGEQGAVLQKFNQELVKCIESLKIRRSKLTKMIEEEERQKAQLESEMAKLKEKLHHVNSSLERKYQHKQNYDTSIKEAEVAFMKILESSESLLSKVKRHCEIFSEDSS